MAEKMKGMLNGSGAAESRCLLCEPQEGDWKHFRQFGRDRIDLAHLIETDNIFVKPDILPALPDGNHFLVVPKPHQYSFASLAHLAPEVGHIMGRLEEEVGEPMVFFEHGSTEAGSKIQSVYHQHGHMMPARGYDVVAYMSDRLRKMGIIHSIINTPDPSPAANLQKEFKGFHYLYIQQGNYGLIAHDNVDGNPTDGFPSQITQRSMSALHGMEVDWKQIPHDEAFARESVARIAHVVDSCRFPSR